MNTRLDNLERRVPVASVSNADQEDSIHVRLHFLPDHYGSLVDEIVENGHVPVALRRDDEGIVMVVKPRRHVVEPDECRRVVM